MAQAARGQCGVGGLGKFTELRQRLLFVLGALIVYRIGCFIPVPGVNPDAMLAADGTSEGHASSTCSTCSQAARSHRFSLFALERRCRTSRRRSSCSCSAQIVPELEGACRRKASPGRRKITQYSRYRRGRRWPVVQACRHRHRACRPGAQPAASPVVYDPGLGFVLDRRGRR